MKTIKALIGGIFLASLTSVWCQGQNHFNSCSAAFLDNKLVVNEYTPTGKCILSQTAKGTLTVAEATYKNKQWHQTAPVEFMVAIRDKDTHTLTTFSKEIYRSLDIQNVMKLCRKGDRIVLLTTSTKYALPHNEILVH